MKKIAIFTFIICLFVCQTAHSASMVEDYLMELGKKFFKKGRLEQAEIEFKKALVMNPQNKKARRYLEKIRGQLVDSGYFCGKINGYDVVCLGDEANFVISSQVDCSETCPQYYWHFGDGTIKYGSQKAKHNYTRPGVYTIVVIVDVIERGVSFYSNSSGMYVKVNAPPIADAGSNLVCCQGVRSLFNASGSRDPEGDKLAYFWDFGDGNTAKGIKATHIYAKGGTYKVTLKVVDDSGTLCNSSTSGFIAKVNTNPIAKMKVHQ